MSATVKMTESSVVAGKQTADTKVQEEQEPGVPKPAAEWSVGFCQCCQYTSPETGKCVAIPLLCPQACCCPAIVLGANTSLLKQEKPLYIGEDEPDRDCGSCLGAETYWKLGEEGNKVCLNTCLLQSLCYALCAGLPVVSLLVHRQRKEIMLKYNMPPVSPLAALAAACCYPCSLFQQHAHLETHHYSHHAPGFRASASGNGLTSVGPLRRGATSKAFRSSSTATPDQPPEDVEMKRDGAPATRPSALQIPDDFLFGIDSAPAQPPSTHDSHHTLPANPPGTPSPAATPSGVHRSHTRSASTSHNSALAAELPSSNPYSGWPLDERQPRSAPSTRTSSIELAGLSHPTSPSEPTPPRASLWNAPIRPNPWATPRPDPDPPPAAPAPYLPNPFASTPSSTAALSPTWQAYDPSPSPSPSAASAASVQPLPWRPTRPPPPRPPTATMSSDSDVVLMGAPSLSQSLAPLGRSSQERRTSDPYPPMQPDKFKSFKPDPMDLSSLVALSSPTASSARPSPMDPSPQPLPDAILRPSASLSGGSSALRSKRYDSLMASIPDTGR